MSSSLSWASVSTLLGARLPLLLVLLWGAYLCARHAGTQRRRVLLVGLAIGLLLLSSAVSLLIRPFLSSGWMGPLGAWAPAIFNNIVSLPNTIAFALLIYAVFYGDEHPWSDDFDDIPPNS